MVRAGTGTAPSQLPVETVHERSRRGKRVKRTATTTAGATTSHGGDTRKGAVLREETARGLGVNSDAPPPWENAVMEILLTALHVGNSQTPQYESSYGTHNTETYGEQGMAASESSQPRGESLTYRKVGIYDKAKS